MVFHRLVERRRNHFAFDRAAHIGDFFRALTDQADHEVDIWAVGADAVGDGLEQHRLTGLGRRDDQPALATANRCNQVQQPRREDIWRRLQIDHFQGKDRGQRIERWPPPRRLRIDAVDRFNSQETKKLLVVLWRAHLSADTVTGPQSEAPDL